MFDVRRRAQIVGLHRLLEYLSINTSNTLSQFNAWGNYIIPRFPVPTAISMASAPHRFCTLNHRIPYTVTLNATRSVQKPHHQPEPRCIHAVTKDTSITDTRYIITSKHHKTIRDLVMPPKQSPYHISWVAPSFKNLVKHLVSQKAIETSSTHVTMTLNIISPQEIFDILRPHPYCHTPKSISSHQNLVRHQLNAHT